MGEVRSIQIAGVSLVCQHCRGDAFLERSARLDRLVLGGLFHLEGWWGHAVVSYACARCGFMHFFSQAEIGEIDRSEGPARPEPLTCLACGVSIREDAEACPQCGWTWKRAST